MDKIKCPYCNKEFKVLWPHLKYKHNVSNMEQFKKDFPDVGLVSDQIRTIHYTNALRPTSPFVFVLLAREGVGLN